MKSYWLFLNVLGFDVRKVQFSDLIVRADDPGHLEALAGNSRVAYDPGPSAGDSEFVATSWIFTVDELIALMALPKKTFRGLFAISREIFRLPARG